MKKTLFAAIAACCIATTSFAQENWVMKVHTNSGEVKEFQCKDVKEVTFDKPGSNTYYADVAATNTYNIYYGSVAEDLAAYTIHLSDGNLTTGGLPTEINKHVLRLTILSHPSQNSYSAVIPDGNYKLIDNTDELGVYYKQSVYIETNKMNSSGKPDGFLDSLNVCNLNVQKRADGTYKLVVEGELKTHGKVRFTYDGKLQFVNKDPESKYQPITDNVTFVPKKMSGRYVKATDTYCDYALTFLNAEVDGEGFIVGAGEYLNLVLLTKFNIPMDINTITGTYDIVMPVNGAVYKEGLFVGGTMFKRGQMTYPVGSYYKEFDGQGDEKFGLFSAGTVTATNNNGSIHFVGNWTTPEGKTVKMDYTANVSDIVDQSQQQDAKPQAQFNSPAANFNNASLNQRVNIKDIQNAGNKIIMIKR